MAAKSTITTLENAEDWDQWMQELKASISEEFWPLADPRQPQCQLMPPPIWPRIQDIASLAVAYVALSQAQQRTYDSVRIIYADDQKQYSREQDTLKEIKTTIQNPVPASKQPDLQPKDSVKQWLQKLKDSIRPSDGVIMTKAKQKYDALFKTRGKPLNWLSK